MNEYPKIEIKILSLIPDKKNSSDNYSKECDFFAFKSEYDIYKFIGIDRNDNQENENEEQRKERNQKELSSELGSVKQNFSLINNEEEKSLVYVFPGHKSMVSALEDNSYIKLFSGDIEQKNEKEKIVLPYGGLLNIDNKGTNDKLEVELITIIFENGT